MVRYNNTIHAIEWYNGTTWQPGSPAFTVIADQQFTGNNVQTVFGLSSTQTTLLESKPNCNRYCEKI